MVLLTKLGGEQGSRLLETRFGASALADLAVRVAAVLAPARGDGAETFKKELLLRIARLVVVGCLVCVTTGGGVIPRRVRKTKMVRSCCVLGGGGLVCFLARARPQQFI